MTSQRAKTGKSSTSPSEKPKVQPKKAPPKDTKKSEETELTPREKAEALVKKFNTNTHWKGIAQVRMASNVSVPYHLRRPTGVMSLDLALGGGWAAGGLSQVYGPGSAGKTHLTFRTAAEVQRNYGDDALIAIACSEMRVDKGFARRSRLYIAYSEEEIQEFENIRALKGRAPFSEEEKADLRKQVGTIMVSAGVTGDVLLDTTIEMLRELGSSCQLIIVESLGSMITPDQDKKDVGDRVYGGSAGMLTTWQNKNYPLFMLDTLDGKPLETTVLCINQVRAVLDAGPHGPKTRPAAGSHSIAHAQLASVELKTGETLYADSSHTEKCGHTIKWEIKKGKAGTHDGLRGEYNWFHMPFYEPVFWSEVEANGSTYGIDVITELCDAAYNLGVVQAGGAYLTFDDGAGEPLNLRGTRDAPAKEQLPQLVVNDPGLEYRLRQACLAKANLTVRVR